MPARSRHMRDALQFLEALTLAAAAATSVWLFAAQIEAVLSPPSQWLWDETPLGFFGIIGVCCWVLGSLPAACAFQLGLSIRSSAFLGLGSAAFMLVTLRTTAGTWAIEKLSIFDAAAVLSGMVGGAVFSWGAEFLERKE